MPPRSAKRKAKKPTPKSKEQSDFRSSTVVDVDNNIIVSELESKEEELVLPEEISTQQENESEAQEEKEAEDFADLVMEEKEIKQENDANLMETEDLSGGHGEDLIVTTTVVETVEVKVGEQVFDKTVLEYEVNVNATGEVVEGSGIVDEKIEMEVVENDNMHLEKAENASEEKEENNEAGDVGNDDLQPVAEQKSAEEKNSTAKIEKTQPTEDNHVVDEGHNGKGEYEEIEDDEEDTEDNAEDNEDNEAEDNEENEDDEGPSTILHDPLTDRKKEKNLEIFIGRLDKGAAEDDLVNVFGKFGEIKTARIARDSTNRSKGFGFIRYATLDQAKSVLTKLKDGIEVRGKHVKIEASQDNDTLYLGNICKTWTKEQVLETLNRCGIEHIEEISLPVDPQIEGNIKGYALLEFNTHTDAMSAFHRLSKPDAVFGHDKSATVAFTQTPMHPNEEILSQVKTVYVEGLTDAWNEVKVKEIGSQYGEVVEVKLSQNLGTKRKRKDYGFITFTSRESALACVEGINNAQIIEGEVKVTATMSKPHFKGRLQKQGFRGGFKVKSGTEDEKATQAGPSEMKSPAKSKRAKRKGKNKLRTVREEKGKSSESKIVEGPKSNKPRSGVSEGQSVGTPSKLEKASRKRKNLPSKVKSSANNNEHGRSKRPSKKLRGNIQGRQSNNFRNPKRDHKGKVPDFDADPVTYRNPYAPGYAASTASYPSRAYIANSASKSHYADMEPHAGYLEPLAKKQARPYLEYLEPAAGTRGLPHAGYLEPAVRTQGRSHASFLEPPSIRAQGQYHGGYLESTNPFDPGLKRAGGYDGQSSSSAYRRAVVDVPPPHVPNYSSYAGYEDSANVGGYYQSSGGQPLRRTYY